MRWPPNSTSGIVIAGLSSWGSDSFSLNMPIGIYLDENNSYIYVSDTYNNRIQRFSLFGGSPNNGTTIAGGNGLGLLNNQFSSPFGLYISKKTKTLYVADRFNNRIQRWKLVNKTVSQLLEILTEMEIVLPLNFRLRITTLLMMKKHFFM